MAAASGRLSVLVTGASGFVGTALVRSLVASGHEVFTLSTRARHERPVPAPGVRETFHWNPEENIGPATPRDFQCDAVVHLAGESVSGRWTQARKDRVLNSRLRGTQLLVESLRGMATPPQVLIGASGIGAYGAHRGATELTEQSPAPDAASFLSRVASETEAALFTAPPAVRTVALRIGMVLAPHGGALAQMLPAYRLCLGGPLGPGTQFTSWISLRDLVRVIEFALVTPSLSGAVNAVAPEPVTSAQFAAELGRALSRPAVVPMPAFALRLLFGAEAADELMLGSLRVVPATLASAGFTWNDASLRAAFAAMDL